MLALSVMPALFSICFIINLKLTQHKAKEKLEQAMLQTIELKKQDFVWEKKGKEIRIGKRLFDIKSIKEEKGKFIITGLYDEQENLLHDQLLNTQKKQDNTSQNKLCNFFFHFYYSIPSAELNEMFVVLPKTFYIDCFSLRLPSPRCETLSPPPNFV